MMTLIVPTKHSLKLTTANHNTMKLQVIAIKQYPSAHLSSTYINSKPDGLSAINHIRHLPDAIKIPLFILFFFKFKRKPLLLISSLQVY